MLHFHPSGLQAQGKRRVGERADTVEHQEFGSNCKCFPQQRRHISRRNKTFRDIQTWVQVPAMSLITCVNLKIVVDVCQVFFPTLLLLETATIFLWGTAFLLHKAQSSVLLTPAPALSYPSVMVPSGANNSVPAPCT